MLEVRDLEVAYGHVRAVRGVSLTVSDGEVVGLIGPNGAGKTSTLAAIAGVIKPRAGEIVFQGESLVGKPPERITPLGVSLVPEGREIFSTLTVEENLQVGLTVRRRSGDPAADMEAITERFPILGTYRRTHAGALSGGEQQQLAIARALLSKPKLMLLDEPSLGLAPMMVDLVFQIVRELKEEGVTVLLVEQNARRTLEFADRTYVVRTGRVQLAGSRQELMSLPPAEIESAFMGFPGERRVENA